jgi:hypothetical protein
MSNKYIKLKFENAKLYPKNKKTNDYVANLDINKDGKLFFKHTKRRNETLTSFKEPITVHQVSNMLHTLVGERPVPSFRLVCYKRNEDIFNIAKNSFINITSPKIKETNKNGEEVETFIKEFTKQNKSAFDSYANPNVVHWFKVKKMMDETYDEFINLINEAVGYDVTLRPFEELLNCYEKYGSKLDTTLEYLKRKKKKPIFNFLTNEKFSRSEITKNGRIIEVVNSGIDYAYFLYGEILIPYDENFVSKLIKDNTNILDGGYVEIVGTFYDYEIEDAEQYTPMSEISDEKY